MKVDIRGGYIAYTQHASDVDVIRKSFTQEAALQTSLLLK
jgi:hypothetical protein